MSKHHKKYGTGRGNYTGHRGATGWFDLNAEVETSQPEFFRVLAWLLRKRIPCAVWHRVRLGFADFKPILVVMEPLRDIWANEPVPILSMPITTTPDDNDPDKIAAAILLLI